MVTKRIENGFNTVKYVRLRTSTCFFAGIVAVTFYLIFSLCAFLQYPGAYSPLTNWLSDLGNPFANPSGAFFYNLGCILTGLALFTFVLGLRTWNIDDKRMRIMLIVAQIMGILSASFLILSAIFPLGSHSRQHSFWSGMLSAAMGFFLTFSATAFLKHPFFKKWIAGFAFLTALVNFLYGMSEAAGYEFFIGEWVSIGMFIIYIVLIVYSYKSINLRRS